MARIGFSIKYFYFHLYSSQVTVDITAHQLRGIVRWMYCQRAMGGTEGRSVRQKEEEETVPRPLPETQIDTVFRHDGLSQSRAVAQEGLLGTYRTQCSGPGTRGNTRQRLTEGCGCNAAVSL